MLAVLVLLPLLCRLFAVQNISCEWFKVCSCYTSAASFDLHSTAGMIRAIPVSARRRRSVSTVPIKYGHVRPLVCACRALLTLPTACIC